MLGFAGMKTELLKLMELRGIIQTEWNWMRITGIMHEKSLTQKCPNWIGFNRINKLHI